MMVWSQMSSTYTHSELNAVLSIERNGFLTKVWEKKLAALFLERDIGLLTSSPKLKDDSSQQTRKKSNKHELCSLLAVKKPFMPFARFTAENCRSASGFMLGILEMGKYPVLPQVKAKAFPVQFVWAFHCLPRWQSPFTLQGPSLGRSGTARVPVLSQPGTRGLSRILWVPPNVNQQNLEYDNHETEQSYHKLYPSIVLSRYYHVPAPWLQTKLLRILWCWRVWSTSLSIEQSLKLQ